jgi:hypothetical protein
VLTSARAETIGGTSGARITGATLALGAAGIGVGSTATAAGDFRVRTNARAAIAAAEATPAMASRTFLAAGCSTVAWVQFALVPLTALGFSRDGDAASAPDAPAPIRAIRVASSRESAGANGSRASATSAID